MTPWKKSCGRPWQWCQHTALLGTIGDIEESRHFTVIDDLSLHTVVEGLYDFNKLLWAANLLEH